MSLIAQEIKIKQLVPLKKICTYKIKTCQHSWKARKEGMQLLSSMQSFCSTFCTTGQSWYFTTQVVNHIYHSVSHITD